MSSRFSSLRTGPKLAKRLARVELGALPDEQLLDYLHAEVHQLSQQQARVWAAMAEVARRAPLRFDHDEAWTPERRFDSAVAEIVAELRISHPTAQRELGYALDLEEQPRVAAALRAGQLDRVKAVILTQACADLTEEHRAEILDAVLPTAATMRVSALKAKVQRIAIALAPGWAERRYREAVRERRVVHHLAEDGTVTLAAENQPAADAMAAKARLTRLADAAQRAGAHAGADLLRSVLLLGLLDSRFTGLSEVEIIAELVAEFPKANDEPAAEPADEPAVEPAAEPAAAPGRSAVDDPDAAARSYDHTVARSADP